MFLFSYFFNFIYVYGCPLYQPGTSYSSTVILKSAYSLIKAKLAVLQ